MPLYQLSLCLVLKKKTPHPSLS